MVVGQCPEYGGQGIHGGRHVEAVWRQGVWK